jgi:uncharacterized membrane protein YhhN
MIHYLFLVLFFGLGIVEIYGEVRGIYKITISLRCIMMPLLILFYIFGAPFSNIDWLIVVALIFGLGGDIFLGLKNKEKWFIYGMASFLFNQIFYIISFFLSITDIAAFPLEGLFLFIPVVLIMLINLPKFINKTEEMKIPVLVYIAAILLMHIAAVLRLADYSGLPFVFVYLGSLSFIFSDSFVAIETFGEKFPKIEIVVMSTYFLAQFYITLGALMTSLLIV